MSAMLRLLAWILAVALVALPVVAVVNGWVGANQFPLRTLRVQGTLQRVDEAQLRATVLPHAHRGFFAVQLDRIQDAVGALPWVERAEVRKHWPDVLEVRISEHRPFARWGKDRLLSEQGRLFPASTVAVPRGLPLLDGPESRVAEVVLGRSDPEARLERFAPLLPRLVAQHPGQRLARADLRYTNGFSLTWVDLPKPPKTTAPLPQPLAMASRGVPSPQPSPASGRGSSPQEVIA